MPFRNEGSLAPVDYLEWRVVGAYVYDPPTDIWSHPITIEEQFRSDLASIPRFVWRAFSPIDRGMVKPAIIHDKLYGTPEYMMSRKTADLIFYYAMLECGANKLKALAAYYAVRVFGAPSFKKRITV